MRCEHWYWCELASSKQKSQTDISQIYYSHHFQKSPNSDRTFESRLLDSEFEDQQSTPVIKNKMLDLKVNTNNKSQMKYKSQKAKNEAISQKKLQAVDSESDSVASEDDLGKKEEMKR